MFKVTSSTRNRITYLPAAQTGSEHDSRDAEFHPNWAMKADPELTFTVTQPFIYYLD
jgi:hypothetical protein